MADASYKTRQIGQLPDKSGTIPPAIWAQPRLPFKWGAPALVGPAYPVTINIPPLPPLTVPSNLPRSTIWPFTWESPWFDLRPDLESIEGQPRLGVPIWSRSARLYVEIVGKGNGPINERGFLPARFRADLVEYYDTTNIDPGQIIKGGPGEGNTFNQIFLQNTTTDVSSVLFPVTTGTVATTLGVFSPPGTQSGGGEGYPVRYWKVVLNFYYTDDGYTPAANSPPQVNLQATYY